MSRAHWSFWLIATVALLWNAMGGINFFMQMNTEMIANFPETHRAIIEGRPIWATIGFAVGVFGGAIGGLLLLLRKQIANCFFIASLLGIIITMIHTINIVRSDIVFTTSEIIIMVIIPVLVAVFFIWYTKLSRNKNWLV